MTTLQICIASIIGIAILTILVILLFKHEWLKALIGFIKDAVADAESKMPVGNGETKKALAMSVIEEVCKRLHIPYFLVKKPVSKLIDKIVDYYNSIAKKLLNK
jgi:RsiW-degrading membrane proteinase PrsW (M82 family)